MSVDHLLKLSALITLVARTGPPDVYGNPTEIVTTAVVPCWIEQTSRGETRDNLAYVAEQTWAFYGSCSSAATLLTAGDRLVVAGVEYELIGPPFTFINARTGLDDHIEATLRRAQ